jgi:hypothetical protein
VGSQNDFLKPGLALFLASLMLQPSPVYAASHREAPITSLDHKADITDWYTFVSPERPDRVVMILNVDPFLEPANGPNYFPFDPGVLYEMKVDNDNDGVEDVTFQFRFQTEIRAPGVFTGFVGNLAGIPPITALDGPGSEGFSLRQSFSVTRVTKDGSTSLTDGKNYYALPSNVGPRTMPNYEALKAQAVYDLGGGVRVFAGAIADPFYIDLGAAFDSLNFRKYAGGGVLSARIDADSRFNYAPNTLTGFNVNTIVLEAPITMLTRDGKMHAAGMKEAVIGTYGTTSRPKVTVLRDSEKADPPATYAQVQRMGNPLINEVIIGTGSKDRFSMDDPKNDSQFAAFFLEPLLAKIFASIGVPVPSAPRTDLLPLVQYMAPICPGCKKGDAGPVADLLRLNTGIPPVPTARQHRLGFLAGDVAGFPNGRRLNDDVFDIASRAVAGILADGAKYGTPIGDGVNVPAVPTSDTFPYVASAYSGRDSVHAGPAQVN